MLPYKQNKVNMTAAFSMRTLIGYLTIVIMVKTSAKIGVILTFSATVLIYYLNFAHKPQIHFFVF